MKKFKPITKIVTILTVVMLLVVCGGTQDCPGFPEYLADYYPYKEGDILKFENSNSDTIVYIVRSVYIVTKHFIDAGCSKGGCSTCDCNLPSLYFSAGDPIFDGLLTGEIVATPNQGHLSVSVVPNNYLIAYANEGKDPFNPKDSLLFGKIVILEPPPHSLENISYVKVIKGEGIVEFFDTETNYLWKKAN
jgi:hypothetical protein